MRERRIQHTRRRLRPQWPRPPYVHLLRAELQMARGFRKARRVLPQTTRAVPRLGAGTCVQCFPVPRPYAEGFGGEGVAGRSGRRRDQRAVLGAPRRSHSAQRRTRAMAARSARRCRHAALRSSVVHSCIRQRRLRIRSAAQALGALVAPGLEARARMQVPCPVWQIGRGRTHHRSTSSVRWRGRCRHCLLLGSAVGEAERSLCRGSPAPFPCRRRGGALLALKRFQRRVVVYIARRAPFAVRRPKLRRCSQPG